jgi:hypothetical protein
VAFTKNIEFAIVPVKGGKSPSLAIAILNFIFWPKEICYAKTMLPLPMAFRTIWLSKWVAVYWNDSVYGRLELRPGQEPQ